MTLHLVATAPNRARLTAAEFDRLSDWSFR